jgi:hypothetical protein
VSDVYQKSARYAIDRTEHFQGMFDVDDEDLRLLLDAKYRETEPGTSKELSEEDKYWEMFIGGTYVPALESPRTDIHFDLEIEYEDIDTETFLDVVYPHFVEKFEERYGDSADDLLYYDPENL